MNSLVVYKSQAQKVREHLSAKKSITPGSALLVYGISRLAVAIDQLRREGMEIDMVLKQDEQGKKYGEYKLRGTIKNGSLVQVLRGHGYGLPHWVKKTLSSKVVGLVEDVAYVQFFRTSEDFETIALNVKELAHVG
jgi:uncharacterized protein YwbE